MQYPGPIEIMVLHEILLAMFGGMRGITEQGFGRLVAATGVPHQSMFGDDLYPTLADKAAALFRALIRNHPFSDGNKRVAVLAVCELLAYNGARLDASNDEVYELALNTASGLAHDQIGIWMHNHIRSA